MDLFKFGRVKKEVRDWSVHYKKPSRIGSSVRQSRATTIRYNPTKRKGVTMSKKVLAFLSLALIASMLFSACQKATTEPTKPPEPVFMTINTEQVSTWVRNFNPFSPDARGATGTAIYEPMMIYNKATGKVVPWLATEYTWNADNTVLTFKIRPGVKWSDGQPFTAKDVVYTFDLLKNNPALSGTASGILNEFIDSFSAPDDLTVEFKFKTVHTPAFYDLANQIIVPEHIWKDVQDPLTWTNDNPVATGPFTQVTKFDTQSILWKRTHTIGSQASHTSRVCASPLIPAMTRPTWRWPTANWTGLAISFPISRRPTFPRTPRTSTITSSEVTRCCYTSILR